MTLGSCRIPPTSGRGSRRDLFYIYVYIKAYGLTAIVLDDDSGLYRYVQITVILSVMTCRSGRRRHPDRRCVSECESLCTLDLASLRYTFGTHTNIRSCRNYTYKGHTSEMDSIKIC